MHTHTLSDLVVPGEGTPGQLLGGLNNQTMYWRRDQHVLLAAAARRTACARLIVVE